MTGRPTVVRHWLAVVGLALLPAWTLAACGDDGEPVVAELPEAGRAWQPLADPPLPARTRTVAVWTGDEVLLVGGDRYACPPAADCMAPTEPPLADGAALDVDAGTWRPIADAPVPFHSASSAVVLDGVVHLLAATDYAGGTALLAYDLATDTWSQPSAPVADLSWYRLVLAGDRVVAYPGSEETGVTGDVVLDPVTGSWSPLPDDPMSPAFDRTMVWASPHLYLLDKENVPNPGSEEPSVLRMARLDIEAGTWEQLPDSELIGGGADWLVDDGRLVSPMLGSADGGEVNGWGRAYPMGGMFDVADMRWEALPPSGGDPDVPRGSGAFGSTAAVYWGAQGEVLDVVNHRWVQMPAPPGVDVHDVTVVAAGRDAVAFVDGHVWIWRP